MLSEKEIMQCVRSGVRTFRTLQAPKVRVERFEDGMVQFTMYAERRYKSVVRLDNFATMLVTLGQPALYHKSGGF